MPKKRRSGKRTVTKSTSRLLSRRSVLLTIAGAGAAFAVREGAGEAVGGLVVKVVEGALDWITRVVSRDPRRALLQSCLFSKNQSFDLLAGNVHPTAQVQRGSGTYVNEECAARALATICNAGLDIEVVPDGYQHHRNHSAIWLGSNRSNQAVRTILGPVDAPTFTCQGPDYQASFEYSIAVAGGAIERLQDRGILRTERRAVFHREGRLAAEIAVDGATQRSDLLMLMRLPKERSKNTSIVLLAGVHGPGMRAVELLKTAIPVEDLRMLADYATNEPYFQALFRVEELETRGGNTIAKAIHLLPKLLRPVGVRPRARG